MIRRMLIVFALWACTALVSLPGVFAQQSAGALTSAENAPGSATIELDHDGTPRHRLQVTEYVTWRAQSALFEVIALSALPVLGCLLVGLLVGVLQAATQVQEQSLSFVPKILVVFALLLLAGAALLSGVAAYASDVFADIASVRF